ncbi:FK506-binding protein 2B [Acidimicrobiaceae bacterium]|nr:FK506-binding protein 2B [Acidimicrobiaceae bacterium]
MHYVGVAWSTAKQFDASWDRNEPFEFGLGAGQVYLRLGQRRRRNESWRSSQTTIPPDMGYGSQGAGGVIKGGETLVFVVDLLNVF